MFTGICLGTGQVTALQRRGSGALLRIQSRTVGFGGLALGDSIAVNGVCLTAVHLEPHAFAADISAETLACTTLARLAPGVAVNLELALRLGDALGGHLVTGHVDGVGEVVARVKDGAMARFTLRAPSGLARYIARKGSIAVDGVSLTVNEVDGDRFTVQCIPHTLELTTLGSYRPGVAVNLEVDLIARYLERLILGDAAAMAGAGGGGIAGATGGPADIAYQARLIALLAGLAWS